MRRNNPFLLSALWIVGQTGILLASEPSVFQLLDDESDRVVLNQLPVELNPLSLGIDQNQIEFVDRSLLPPEMKDELSRFPIRDILEQENIAPTGHEDESLSREQKIGPNNKSERRQMERARLFQELGFIAIAREHYADLIQREPNNRTLASALESLDKLEVARLNEKCALAEKKGNTFDALQSVNQLLTIAPHDIEAQKMKQTLLKKQTLQADLQGHVDQKLSNGIDYFNRGKYEMALSRFVEVLNLDPQNQQALNYINRIGEQQSNRGRP